MARALYILTLSIVLISCSSPRIVAPPRGYDYDRPRFAPLREEASKSPFRYPWEQWPLEADLAGSGLSSYRLIQGDQAFSSGERTRACSIYKTVDRRRLPLPTYEALIARLASCDMAVDQPSKALTTIGGFVKSQKRKMEEIDPHLMLIMAYAQGRKSNIEQSLIWFSRLNRLPIARGTIGRAGEAGARDLLKSIEIDKLRKISSDWQTEPFIRALVGQEIAQRSRTGRAVARDSKPFDAVRRRGEGARQEEFSPGVLLSAAGVPTIGVLLPLTGTYGVLGRNTRNGIDIALGSEVAARRIKLVSEDSGSDSESAARGLVKLVDQQQSQIILGPLLSESTVALSGLIVDRSLPVISYSKKTNLPLTDSMFRLGATTQSQVDSLLTALDENLNISRFALVYPQDSNGIEFAESFRVALNQRGYSPLIDIGYYPDNKAAFSDIAREIEASEVQAMFVPDSLDQAYLIYSAISSSRRAQIRLLGPGVWDGHRVLTNSKTILEGATFVSPFFDRSKDPLITNFIKAFQSKYRTKPDFLAAQGFDSATMVIAALKREREQGVPFMQGFRDINRYSGLTGEISVDSDSGEILRRFKVLTIKNGELIELNPSSL